MTLPDSMEAPKAQSALNKLWQWARAGVLRVLVKPVLALAALGTAATYLFVNVPTVYDTVFWRQSEYGKLRQLHAGYSLSYMTSKLGEPASVKIVTTQPALKQYLYLKRDYIVELLVDSSDEAVLFSVLSCDSKFKPEFDTPAGSVVTLQGRPLSQAEHYPVEHPTASEVADLNNRRFLAYNPATTGSGVDMLVEDAGSSTATRDRGYYLGVNGVCTDMTELAKDVDIKDLNYYGWLENAPPASWVRPVRDSVAANFYAETVDQQFRLDSDAVLVPEKRIEDNRVFVSPFKFDLPESEYKPAGTTTFHS
jgi:hypothetical protein